MSRKFRLGIVVPDIDDGTSFYRSGGPLQALVKSHNHLLEIEPGANIRWVWLRGLDAVFMQRPFTDMHIQILEMAKMNGKPVWVDYDDDLYTVPQQNPTHALYSQQKVQQNITRFIAEADVLTVSTQQLKDKFGRIIEKIGSQTGNENIPRRFFSPDKISILPNSYDEELFGYSYERWNEPLPDGNLLMLWRGSSTHDADLSAYTMPITQAFAQAGWNWTANFIGSPWWGTLQAMEEAGIEKDRIIKTQTLDVITMHRYMYDLKPSIFIVPLLDDVFNKAKSNIAWIESTHAGSMTMAPDWPEWRRPGIINYSNGDDFRNKLNHILKGRMDRVSLVNQSREYIAQNLLLSRVNHKRLQILDRLEDLGTWTARQKSE